jgi:3-oxoacyl-[acyl-carrier-protein] synthase-3
VSETTRVPAAGPSPRAVASARIGALAGVRGAVTVRNADSAAVAGVTEDWVLKRIGVRERCVAPPDQRLCELAAEAGEAALARSEIGAEDLDLVIVATCTHDHIMPSAASLVSAAVGAREPATMDVNSVCNGFLSALTVGAGAIESGRCGHALIIGADVLSRFVDATDRRTAPVFGDGAGAVVLSPDTGVARLGAHVLHSDARGAELIRCSSTGPMHMEGERTYRNAVDRMSEVTLSVLERAELDLGDIDLFVYHQANVRILKAVGARLGLDPDRVLNTMESTGNTSAASIPLALAEADAQGRLEPGTRVLAAGFGSGFSYGAMIFDWDSP